MTSRVLTALLLSLVALSRSFAQTETRYIQLENEDALVYMDEEGVAIRVERMWDCRDTNWPPANGWEGYNWSQFKVLRDSKVADGTWNSWTCRERPGEILWSRKLLEAQRKLNASLDKRPCSPWVPETGRYNREMFEFSLCTLKSESEAAREAFDAQKVLRLGVPLRMEPPSSPSTSELAAFRSQVLVAAREQELRKAQEGCGRALTTLLEYVECRMRDWDLGLTEAEQRLAELAGIVDALPRDGRIYDFQVRELKAQSEAVKKALQRATLASEQVQ